MNEKALSHTVAEDTYAAVLHMYLNVCSFTSFTVSWNCILKCWMVMSLWLMICHEEGYYVFVVEL